MPSASPALPRSTNRRVRSSGRCAFSVVMAPGCARRLQKSNRSFFCFLESLVMELRQLEYLVAVAEEANFTRAAERVHISQSGVSAQVRALEAEVGAELFDRSGRAARPTAAGAAALPYARAALAAAGALRQGVDDVNGLVRGRL